MPSPTSVTPSPSDDQESNTRPVRHPFVVLSAKSEKGSKMVKVTMPGPQYKMVCGGVTSVGNTIVMGCYPESATVWAALHDPARTDAHIVLKVLAIVDDADMYETTVKRLVHADLVTENPSAWGGADPKNLLESKGKECSLTCPVPLKYSLCGGGFCSPMPVFSSMPVTADAYTKALVTRRETEAFGGGGWNVTGPADNRLAVFAVGLRVRRSVGSDTKIVLDLDGDCWKAQLPQPQGNIVVHLGGTSVQDPAAAALYLAPSEASKVAISKAPPSVWAQYHTPYRSMEERERDAQYTKQTTL